MKNNLTTIYLVRHGESEANAGGDGGLNIKYGELGSPLSEKGIKQALSRKASLKDVHFDAVFSSDLLRTVRTAEIITEERELAVKTSDAIREREASKYIKNHTELTREKFLSDLRATLKDLTEKEKMQYKHSEHMESAEEAAVRLITFLREIAVAYPGKTVLVINHGTVMRSFLTHIGWAKYDELPTGTIENTGYAVLESDGVDFFVKETHGIHKQQGKLRDW